MDTELLNSKQAAAHLGIDRSRVYALSKAGKIGRKMAGFLVFTREELDRYEATRNKRGGRPRKKPVDF